MLNLSHPFEANAVSVGAAIRQKTTRLERVTTCRQLAGDFGLVTTCRRQKSQFVTTCRFRHEYILDFSLSPYSPVSIRLTCEATSGDNLDTGSVRHGL